MTRRIGPGRTPNPYIPRDGAWFHQQYGADGQLYSYARGDRRAFVHVDRDGAVSWAVCRVMETAEWHEGAGADATMRYAFGLLESKEVV